MILRAIAFFILLPIANALCAQTFHITGRTTTANEGLGFVYILAKNGRGGTSANAEGYYDLALPAGEHQLEFRFLGYRTEYRKVTLNADMRIDVELLPVAIQLEEVRAYGGDENPAYSIMKNAIAQKDYFRSQRTKYTCGVYTKGLLRVDELPAKVMGIKVPDEDLKEFMETGRKGIFYLSETVSEVQFQPPRKFHETVKSSIVSGKDFDYSLNQASVLQVDLYENLVLKGLNERGFLSPFSPAAFTYYSFRLEGAYYEGKYLINRIAVIPRAKMEPLFRGHVYVVDSSWAVYGANLYITKDAGIELFDTVRLEQNLIEPSPNLWLPASTKLSNHIDVLGIKASGYLLGVFSEYKFAVAPEKKPAKGEIMKIAPSANEKDSLYWTTIRPVPLLVDEISDYKYTDSIFVVKNDPVYKDSVEKENNKLRILNILIGSKTVTWDKSNLTLQLQGLAEYRSYNTVEGVALSLSPSITYKYAKTAWITAQPFVRYGIGNKMFHARLVTDWQIDVIKLTSLRVDFGQHPFQFNRNNPIGLAENNIYTLFGQNFMKLFLSRFVNLRFNHEIGNGLSMQLGASLEDNHTMKNTSDFSFMPDRKVYFTSNNPLDPMNQTDPFPNHQVLRLQVEFRYKPGQKFVTTPNNRYRIEKRNIPQPFVSLNYSPALNATSPEFVFTRAGIDWPLQFGLAGLLSLHVSGGAFTKSDSRPFYFTDNHHFNGNQTVFWNTQPGSFRVLNYYNQYDNGTNTVISSSSSFAQLNAEHKFHGFLLSKIPLLKRLGWEESVGFNYLITENINGYYELGGGIENISLIKKFPGFLAVYFYGGFGGGLNSQSRILFKIGF